MNLILHSGNIRLAGVYSRPFQIIFNVFVYSSFSACHVDYLLGKQIWRESYRAKTCLSQWNPSFDSNPKLPAESVEILQ